MIFEKYGNFRGKFIGVASWLSQDDKILKELDCYTQKSDQIHFGSYSGEHNVVSGALRALNCSKSSKSIDFLVKKNTFFYDEKSPEKKGDFCQKSPKKIGDLKSEKKHYQGYS